MKFGRFDLVGMAGRLLRDRRGNAMMLTAAVAVPMLILAASVVDISRLYITRSRLQSACDAGALAGRKAMHGITWTAADETVARNLFNANFPDGMMNSSSRTIKFSVDQGGSVSADATALVPATITGMLGAVDATLKVSCRAELQLPDTDVMFALDTTGSMTQTNPGDSVSRIAALRAAVKNFHSTVQANAAGGSEIRYGFVPFSSTVNVGYLLHRDWMVDDWTYQSRIPDGTSTSSSSGTSTTSTSYSGWTVLSGGTSTHITWGSSENCVKPGNTYNASDTTSTSTSPYPGGGTKTVVTRTRRENGSTYVAEIVSGACRITETRYNNRVIRRTETTIPANNSWTSTWTNYFWTYRPVSYDVSGLKGSNANGLMAGGSVTAPVGNNHSNVTATWQGCIEERDTTYISNYGAIPTNAYDLDIDLVPTTNDATRWRPFLPQLVFVRRSTTNWDINPVVHTTSNYQRADGLSNASVCPTRARKLAPMTSSEVTSYVNGLAAGGYTYLDIGMLWAARMISPTGIFSAENNGANKSRHIIFMTDGQIQTTLANYEAYGLAALDRRRTQVGVAPYNSMIDDIVSDRFDALCSAAKAKGITIWVVAFGTTLSTQLTDCATGGRAFQANNAAELDAAFQDIASRIAQLRITK